MPSPISETADAMSVLLARAGGCVVALPIEHVVETMRPLPVEPVPDMPAFLKGLAVIRGEAVPVVDLNILLGGSGVTDLQRFIVIRVEQRRVAVAVEAVLEVLKLQRSLRESLPPLLKHMSADLVAAVSVRDQQLLLMLQTASLVPEEVWRTLESREKD